MAIATIQRSDTPLLDYLGELGAREQQNFRASRATKVARAIVPAAIRPRLKSQLTRLASARSRRAAARLVRSGRDIRLHFGCGEIHLDGWANIDVVGAGAADFLWDLRYKLPFPDGSVSAIFHEHLTEHLTYWQVVPLFRECRRLLKPGGVVRLGVPDFGRYARDYATDSGFINQVRPGRPTALLAMAEIAYCYQHRSMWDGVTLVALSEEIGFTEMAVHASGDSRIKPAPDTDYRQPETVYVEGIVPSSLQQG